MTSSSDDKTSSIERDLNSTTTTTSDDDATHYHAYTQTSDSDSFPSMHGVRKRGRVRHHRGRSIDPTCPSSSQSSSDLSSPNESCYSFVRRALQKLAGTRRNRGGRRPWFLQGLDIAAAAGTEDIVGAAEQFAYMDCGEDIGLDYPHPHHRGNDGENNGASGGGAAGGGSMSIADNFIPIELRQLESTEYADLFQQPAQNHSSSAAQSATSKAALLFSNVLYPRRRRTLETTCGDLGHSSEAQAIGAQPKSKSLSDLLGLLPVSLLRSSAPHYQHRKSGENGEARKKRHHHRSTATSGTEAQANGEDNIGDPNLSPLVQSFEDPWLGPFRRHVSVQTEYLDENFEESPTSSSFHLMFPQQAQNGGDQAGKRRSRPLLVKQKHSICSDPEEEEAETEKDGEKSGGGGSLKRKSNESLADNGMTLKLPQNACDDDSGESSDHFDTNERRSPRESGISPKKISPREPDVPTQQPTNKKLKYQKKSIVPPSAMPFWKQTSMNDELIFSSERLKEKERLKQQVQKQCSLNEELIYNKGRKGTRPVENNRWDQMKEAFLKNSSNVKCFQLIKNGLSRGFRGSNGGGVTSENGGQNGNLSTTPSSLGTATFGDIIGQTLPDIGITSGSAGSGVGTNGDALPTPETVSGINSDHSQSQNSGGNTGDFFYSQQSTQAQQSARSQSSSGTGATGGGTTSLRNGIVRMLQNWKQSEEGTTYPPGSPGGHRYNNANSGSSTSARRALFPPFFLRRSSAGSLTLVGKQGNKQDHHHHHLNHHGQCSSPGPLSPLGKTVAGETGDMNGSSNGGSTTGNKLLPGVRHVRKLSREDGSDSSKDSSFQSDTSVDSEDSFASVIFIPKSGGLDDFGGDFCGTRANSTDSDRSPKSPASRLSPPNHGNLPKSPSPLAQEVQAIMRRRSPEMSPADHGRHLRLTPGGSTTSSGFGSSGGGSGSGEVTKFLFDEATTRLLAGGDDSGASDLTLSQSSASHPPLSPGVEAAIYPETSVTVPSIEQKQTSQVVVVGPTETEDCITFPVFQHPHSPPLPTTVVIPPSTRSSGKKRVEKIEVLRKPGVAPEGKSGYTRQLVRRSLPKSLAVELFNPETDDADTSDTSSSSPNSVSSVVSVVNEDSSAGAGGNTSGGGMDEAKQPIITEEEFDEIEEAEELDNDDMIAEADERGPLLVEEEDVDASVDGEQPSNVRKSSSSSVSGAAVGVVSSLENLVTNSTSPRTRRKSTISKLGSTSEWLSSLELTAPPASSAGTQQASMSENTGNLVISTATATRKTTMKSIKKAGLQKSSGEEVPQIGLSEAATEGNTGSTESAPVAGNSMFSVSGGGTLSVEMLEERDSLFDSMENLTNNSNNSRQQPSRNPSIDSSVRMSSTCSCSIRGGDSFDSWTSAKSSLTNSSCTQPPPLAPHKTSLASMISLPMSSSGLPPGTAGASGGTGTAGSHGGGSFPISGSTSSTTGGALPSKISSLDSNGTNHKGYAGAGAVGGGGSSSSSAAGRRREAQSRIRVQSSSKSSSAAGEDAEDSTALTCHRYYHVFREGELDKLIEKYVQNLHIISSYYDHANWCIIAEKVQVWTI